ncbi:MAG: hypothetical protein Q9163_003553 [Psora crenata]
MAKRSKLLTALDAHRGRDRVLDKQKKLRKRAARKGRSRESQTALDVGDKFEVIVNGSGDVVGGRAKERKADESKEAAHAGDDTTQSMRAEADSGNGLRGEDCSSTASAQNTIQDGCSSQEVGTQEDEMEDGIPLSDIESLVSSEREDILPHQRLSINNKAALLRVYDSISLPYASLSFSAHQTLTTPNRVSIPDVHDDLNRELVFYKQCLDAANKGRALLKKEGVPFTRPNDYFAEMVKSDEQMGKVKQKMVDEAAHKRASSEARRQRELKKFGKQVQVAKQQERAREKRETLDKINLLKRMATNEEDLFDVALENTTAKDDGLLGSRGKGKDLKAPNKRRKRDEKFGYGGKKRFSKSGDALSSGDMTGYSARKMKGSKGSAKRLGKSRRAKAS